MRYNLFNMIVSENLSCHLIFFTLTVSLGPPCSSPSSAEGHGPSTCLYHCWWSQFLLRDVRSRAAGASSGTVCTHFSYISRKQWCWVTGCKYYNMNGIDILWFSRRWGEEDLTSGRVTAPFICLLILGWDRLKKPRQYFLNEEEALNLASKWEALAASRGLWKWFRPEVPYLSQFIAPFVSLVFSCFAWANRNA